MRAYSRAVAWTLLSPWVIAFGLFGLYPFAFSLLASFTDYSPLRAARAHFVGAAYLQDLAADADIPNFAEYSAELSRDFRGLRVWFPLKLHGVSAFREALDEKLDLAVVLYEELKADPNLELPWAPDLTVVPFRLRDGDDEANRRLLAAINASERVFVSSTIVEGRFTIRACILSHRTHRDRIDECIGIVRDAAAELV